MKVLVLGAAGQVGNALQQRFPQGIFWDRSQADFEAGALLKNTLASVPSDVVAVVNAAAFTQVDLAESERDRAYRVNALAPMSIAEWAKSRDIPFVHFSTDYVYDGTGSAPHRETDPIKPLNTYGKSKAEGDLAIERTGGRFAILRTSWIFDSKGRNFPRTILRLAETQDTLRVVNDQWGSPTYAADLAGVVQEILSRGTTQKAFPSGVYHACSQGETHWFGLAQAVLALASEAGRLPKMPQVMPVSSADFPTAAKRPANSRLDTTKIREVFGLTLPPWEEALRRCLLNR